MVASIILLTISIIIFLDSMGSKRIRSAVIRRVKSGFTKSLESENQDERLQKDLPKELQQYLENTGTLPDGLNQNIRLKFKGSKRRLNKKRWIPLEAKYFLSVEPLQMDFYQDATLGFLCSQKTVSHWSVEDRFYFQRLFSLFPQRGGKLTESSDFLLWAGIPWLAEIALSTQVEWTALSKHQAAFQVEIDSKQMKGVCIFGEDTYLKTLTLSWKEGTEEDGLVINYQDYKPFESRILPFAFHATQRCGKSSWEYQFQVTDIVENETFAWW